MRHPSPSLRPRGANPTGKAGPGCSGQAPSSSPALPAPGRVMINGATGRAGLAGTDGAFGVRDLSWRAKIRNNLPRRDVFALTLLPNPSPGGEIGLSPTGSAFLQPPPSATKTGAGKRRLNPPQWEHPYWFALVAPPGPVGPPAWRQRPLGRFERQKILKLSHFPAVWVPESGAPAAPGHFRRLTLKSGGAGGYLKSREKL